MSATDRNAGEARREMTSDASPEMTYEAARAELREIVATLESGGQGLEESLALWERGEQLADLCQRWLDNAGERLDAAIAAREAGESARD